MLLGRLAWIFAQMINDPQIEMPLLLMGIGYEKFCGADNVRDRAGSAEGQDAPGTFHIWRV